MKFKCGPSWETKFKARQEWHRWFAWRPVRVADGDCRWLEYVERKGKFWEFAMDGGWDWKYREIQSV